MKAVKHDEIYWKEMSRLTSSRMTELADSIVTRGLQGSALRWLHGMHETNKQWNFIANYQLYNIEKYRQANAAKASYRAVTFRGNDDE